MPDLTVWPTDGADGAVSSEARWRKMGRVWVPSGVDDSPLGIGGGAGALAPTLVAGPTINVAIGGCYLDGHYAELTTPASVPATANGLLVVRFTPADNHAELLWRDAATTPTQTLATWELGIAQMQAGALTDRRYPARLGWPSNPVCVLRTSTALVVGTGAVIVVSWTAANSTETHDPDGLHDPVTTPNRITFQVPGLYDIATWFSWAASAGGSYRYSAIRSNTGAVLASSRQAHSGAANTVDHCVGTLWPFRRGEWCEAVVAQDSGGNLNLSGQLQASFKSPIGTY